MQESRRPVPPLAFPSQVDPTSRHRWSRSRRARAVVLVLVTLLAGGTLLEAPVGGQESIDDARRQREAVRREKAEVAATLELLRAEDAEVAAALADIDAYLSIEQAKLDAAQLAVDAAEQARLRWQEEIARTEAEMEALRAQLRDRAVAAYVTRGDEDARAWLESDGFGEASKKQALLDQVNTSTGDVIDHMRVVEDEQRVAEREAAIAVAEADELRAELAEVVAEIETHRAAQAAVKAELDARIAEWERQADAFAAEERKLSAFIRERQAEIDRARVQARAPSAFGFRWPAAGRVTSGFGMRRHPIFGRTRMHSGIDIDASSGEPVWAAKDGTVIRSGWANGYGNVVIIDHGDGVTTVYAHLSRRDISSGRFVGSGEVIGRVGSTGWSTGPHLHFEIRLAGDPVDPRPYLP